MKFLVLALLFVSSHVYAVSAHIHGLANIDIATDKNQILIMFKSPGYSLFGFGTKPKTDKQKEVYNKIKKDWSINTDLFEVTSQKCRPKSTQYKVDHSGGNHCEVLAEVTYECESKATGSTLKIKMGKTWKGVHEFHMQLLREDGSVVSKKYRKKEFELKL